MWAGVEGRDSEVAAPVSLHGGPPGWGVATARGEANFSGLLPDRVREEFLAFLFIRSSKCPSQALCRGHQFSRETRAQIQGQVVRGLLPAERLFPRFVAVPLQEYNIVASNHRVTLISCKMSLS